MIKSLRLRRTSSIVLDEIGLEVNVLDDFKFYGGGKGGGGGGVQYIPMQQAPTYNEPPPAPPKTEEATMELAEETPEDTILRKEATKLGAKSLRIPIGTTNTLSQM